MGSQNLVAKSDSHRDCLVIQACPVQWFGENECDMVFPSSLPSLKLTWHLKMDGWSWNTSFLLGWPIFRGYVSFRERISFHIAIFSHSKI